LAPLLSRQDLDDAKPMFSTASHFKSEAY